MDKLFQLRSCIVNIEMPIITCHFIFLLIWETPPGYDKATIIVSSNNYKCGERIGRMGDHGVSAGTVLSSGFWCWNSICNTNF